MSTRLEGAKFRALQKATLRSEYGFDMVALLNSLDDKSNSLEDIEALLSNIEGINDTNLPLIVSLLTSINGKTVTIPVAAGRVQVEPLGIPTVSRPVTATASSAVINLSPSCRRISIRSVTGAIRYEVAAAPATPNATTASHFVDAAERIEIAVPENGRIAIRRANTTDVQVEISELS